MNMVTTSILIHFIIVLDIFTLLSKNFGRFISIASMITGNMWQQRFQELVLEILKLENTVIFTIYIDLYKELGVIMYSCITEF